MAVGASQRPKAKSAASFKVKSVCCCFNLLASSSVKLGSIFDAEKLRTFSGYERIPKEMLKKEMLIAVCELLDSILVISVPRLFF